MRTKRYILLMVGICALAAFACAPKAREKEAVLDTPEHHYNNGIKFFNKGDLNKAEKEFVMARELSPKFAPAYVGLGLVAAAQGDFKKAEENMKKADGFADGDGQKYMVHVGFIRYYTIAGTKADEDWLDEAEDRFDDAKKLKSGESEAYYYMGVAYRAAFEFGDAARMFRKVLDLNKDFVAEADKEYKVLQKIERAMPGSKVGKQIALLPKINRADVAALFIEELKLDELYAKMTKKEWDTKFKGPEKEFKTGEFVKVAPATDIENHVLKHDIDAVIKIGIKGLEPFPDHTFQPDKPLTRAEFAIMVEDILLKITRDEQIATKFIGQESPFPDLRSTHWAFNAIMIATTRGIIEVKDQGTGEFELDGNISGADAMLSIRTLKTQLRSYY